MPVKPKRTPDPSFRVSHQNAIWMRDGKTNNNPKVRVVRETPTRGTEAELERTYSREGIPVGPEHRARLEEMAAEIGIEPPWQGKGNNE